MGKKVVHVEFPAQDVDRGQRFWEGVGGWSIKDSGMPGIDYRMFQEGEGRRVRERSRRAKSDDSVPMPEGQAPGS
jgi:predicted enzyme related to lactoylglutathione lyase